MSHSLRPLVSLVGAMLALPFRPGRSEKTAIQAAYLFHRSGDPLATVASDQTIPFEPGQLEPILGAVRGFVEESEPKGRGLHQTSERFGEETLVAVRGRFVSACAVFRGNGEANLRRDLIRLVRGFEERNETSLDTWEQAIGLAEEASRELTDIVNGPIASIESDSSGNNGNETAHPASPTSVG